MIRIEVTKTSATKELLKGDKFFYQSLLEYQSHMHIDKHLFLFDFFNFGRFWMFTTLATNNCKLKLLINIIYRWIIIWNSLYIDFCGSKRGIIETIITILILRFSQTYLKISTEVIQQLILQKYFNPNITTVYAFI